MSCTEVQGPIELAGNKVCSRCYENVVPDIVSVLGNIFGEDLLVPEPLASLFGTTSKYRHEGGS